MVCLKKKRFFVLVVLNVGCLIKVCMIYIRVNFFWIDINLVYFIFGSGIKFNLLVKGF